MIKFLADKIRINGPRVDGTYTISFEVGEYEKKKVLTTMMFEPPVEVEVKHVKN